MKNGAELITEERLRQISQEDWTAQHDDAHDGEELVDAAAIYLDMGTKYEHNLDNVVWPWDQDDFKPTDRIRNLVKAGALIAAEIDRLQRARAIEEIGHE